MTETLQLTASQDIIYVIPVQDSATQQRLVPKSRGFSES